MSMSLNDTHKYVNESVSLLRVKVCHIQNSTDEIIRTLNLQPSPARSDSGDNTRHICIHHLMWLLYLRFEISHPMCTLWIANYSLCLTNCPLLCLSVCTSACWSVFHYYKIIIYTPCCNKTMYVYFFIISKMFVYSLELISVKRK